MLRKATSENRQPLCVRPHAVASCYESHITTLNVGQQTATNIIDSNDEIVVIKSGHVEVTVNGIASRMNEGSLLYWAPNDKRTLRNIHPRHWHTGNIRAHREVAMSRP
jgi:glyoxylate utilization-related uncharacterized protein